MMSILWRDIRVAQQVKDLMFLNQNLKNLYLKNKELIKKEKPVAVINCTVLHTWHLIRQLPEKLYARISSAGLGAWLPCQLALGLNLAKAIKESGEKPYFINTSLSCLTNPVMGKIGLAPTDRKSVV